MPEKKKSRHPANARGTWLYRAALLAMLALVVLAAVYIVKFYRERSETNALNAQLHALMVTSEPTASAQPSAASTMQTTISSDAQILAYPTPPAEIRKELVGLHSLNPDLVGRLHIPTDTEHTAIDQFVLKRDNEYYLTHDFYGDERKSGAVFMDEANEIWPQDQHMILYGHNMKNGTMFARLTQYSTIKYAARNPFIYFDTIYETGTYVVLAAMRLPAKETMTPSFNIRTFFFGDASFNSFLYAIQEHALYVTTVGADANDQLLSLVTCSYNEDDERFILITRRLRENETEDDIRALIKGSK